MRCSHLLRLFLCISICSAEAGAQERAPEVDLDDGDALPATALARLGQLRWRHALRDGNGFAQVSFSRDDKLVISTSEGFRLWDVNTGKPVVRFAHNPPIEAAMFAPDGKTLITLITVTTPQERMAKDPNRVKQVIQHSEVGTGRILRELSIARSPDFHRFAVLSADGKWLLANDRDKKLRLWDTLSGKILFEFDGHLNYGTTAPFALSANGTRLALAGVAGAKLSLYDTSSGEQVRNIKHDAKAFTGPALSPDGKILVASAPTSLCVWDAETGELRREFKDCRGVVAFSPDGKYLACGDKKAIRLWKTESLREVRRFDDHEDHIRALAFSSDGRRIVTGQEHSVGLWDVKTGEKLNRLDGHHGVVYSLAFSADGTGLASGADDGAAIVWDLATRKIKQRFGGHYLAAVSLAFSHDSKTLATGDGQAIGGIDSRLSPQIRLWDLRNSKLSKQFNGHQNSVESLAFSPDDKQLASGGHDECARVWDPVTGKMLYEVPGGRSRRTVAYSPDGKVLLAASSELLLWQAHAGKELRSLETTGKERRYVVSASFLRDGKTVVSEEYGVRPRDMVPRKPTRPALDRVSQLRFWDAATGKELRSFALEGAYPYYDNAPSGHAVSPDGALAATYMDNRREPTIQLWDTASGKLLAALRGHTKAITVLAFSPDGKTLASGSRDTTVLLWRVSAARLIGLWHQLSDDSDEGRKAVKTFVANGVDALGFLKERLQQAAAQEAPYARLVADLDAENFQARDKALRRLQEAGPAAELALRLALRGKDGLEFKTRVKRALERLTALRAEEIKRLIADLAGPKADDAANRLRDLGKAAEPELRRVLERPPFEERSREDLMTGFRVRNLVSGILSQRSQPGNAPLPLTATSAFRALEVLEHIGTPQARAVLEEVSKGPAESRLVQEARSALGRLKHED